ncbi:Uncharacterised protein [Candidatus Bilamarchaeum dharawalense]|uniref:Uncharacterized protein n=1 Tax=Candidatus Bilamarchaeum dharawalense TaxID=2885759 RepID=A0A5E4LWB0_9ARCH|nr:Uncharacterised protein [Candidatus Bilamarchaeum dharawalense]
MTSSLETHEMWLIARHHPDESTRIEAGLRIIKSLNDNELIQAIHDRELPFQIRLAATKYTVRRWIDQEEYQKLEILFAGLTEDMLAHIVKSGLRDLALVDGHLMLIGQFNQIDGSDLDVLTRISRIVIYHEDKGYRAMATKRLIRACEDIANFSEEVVRFLINLAEDERFSIDLRVAAGNAAVGWFVDEGGKNTELVALGNNPRVLGVIQEQAGDRRNHETADMNYLAHIDFMLDREQLTPEEAGFMYLEFAERQTTTEKGNREATKRFDHLRSWVREKAIRDLEQERAAQAIMEESTVKQDEVSSMTRILTEYVRCCVGRNRDIAKFFRALGDERVPGELREKAKEIARRTAIAAAERYGLGLISGQPVGELGIRLERIARPSEGENRNSRLRRIPPAGHA